MKIILLLSAALLTFGCAKKDAIAELDMAETAQQIGDVMASIDEAGGSSGSIASLQKSSEKTFARYSPNTSNELNKVTLASQLIQSNANAATCSGNGFGTCSATTANTIVRTFGGCTVGEATFTGTVALAWTGISAASCTLNSVNDTITRVPNFTATGRRGSTVLAVTKSSTYGQKLTWASGAGTSKTFTLSSDGINRKFTLSGNTLFNQTTTASGISVIGTARAGRILSGGSLIVTNDMTAVTCTYVPSAITWTAGCNCPTSGTWNGSCTSGTTSVLAITACGTGTYTEGTTSTTVVLDRCGT